MKIIISKQNLINGTSLIINGALIDSKYPLRIVRTKELNNSEICPYRIYSIEPDCLETQLFVNSSSMLLNLAKLPIFNDKGEIIHYTAGTTGEFIALEIARILEGMQCVAVDTPHKATYVANSTVEEALSIISGTSCRVIPSSFGASNTIPSNQYISWLKLLQVSVSDVELSMAQATNNLHVIDNLLGTNLRNYGYTLIHHGRQTMNYGQMHDVKPFSSNSDKPRSTTSKSTRKDTVNTKTMNDVKSSINDLRTDIREELHYNQAFTHKIVHDTDSSNRALAMLVDNRLKDNKQDIVNAIKSLLSNQADGNKPTVSYNQTPSYGSEKSVDMIDMVIDIPNLNNLKIENIMTTVTDNGIKLNIKATTNKLTRRKDSRNNIKNRIVKYRDLLKLLKDRNR